MRSLKFAAKEMLGFHVHFFDVLSVVLKKTIKLKHATELKDPDVYTQVSSWCHTVAY